MSASTCTNHLNLGLPALHMPSGLVLNKPYLVSTVASFDLFGLFLWVSEHLIFYGRFLSPVPNLHYTEGSNFLSMFAALAKESHFTAPDTRLSPHSHLLHSVDLPTDPTSQGGIPQVFKSHLLASVFYPGIHVSLRPYLASYTVK
jgi:hypothetical protein